MKSLMILPILLLFFGCSKPVKPTPSLEKIDNTYVMKRDFQSLPSWQKIDYEKSLNIFLNNCKTKKAKNIYKSLCQDATKALDAKAFFENNFTPFEIYTKNHENEGLLTGYYEPKLNGSMVKTDRYKYPIYTTPKDLIEVDLDSIYPDLKGYRLRGRLVDNKLVPYYPRAQKDKIETDVICYVDSKIDLFFLEVQGSGRVELDDGSTIFVGYDNQNGHRYRSIGKYLIELNEIKREDISLQSIKKWLLENPDRIDEVLNYNSSLVFFEKNNSPATGSLGIELIASSSVAVDPKYIQLGTMLYVSSIIDDKEFHTIVAAQDTGGAIKGSIRADLFLGHSEDAKESAGKLKSPLKLWIFLPNGENL
jgi:membrane-bound lytic murein transglycosylase A